MSYRLNPVIPADFRPSQPECPHEDHVKGRLRALYDANHRDDTPPYSRSTMSYSIAAIIASMAFVAAGMPFLGITGMSWWLWATFPIGGATLGLLVLIWRGGKDSESRRVTGWKAIFGMVAGVGAPRIWMLIHPAITDSTFMSDPIVLGVLGFLSFLLGSGMAAGVMKYWDKDAPKVGYDQTKRTVEKFTQPSDKLNK